MQHVVAHRIICVTILLVLLSPPNVWKVRASPLTEVSLADAHLQACLQPTAQAQGWSDTEEVISPTCVGDEIAGLAGLEALANLRHLNLRENDIMDLTPLAALTNLQALALDDLSPRSPHSLGSQP